MSRQRKAHGISDVAKSLYTSFCTYLCFPRTYTDGNEKRNIRHRCCISFSFFYKVRQQQQLFIYIILRSSEILIKTAFVSVRTGQKYEKARTGHSQFPDEKDRRNGLKYDRERTGRITEGRDKRGQKNDKKKTGRRKAADRYTNTCGQRNFVFLSVVL